MKLRRGGLVHRLLTGLARRAETSEKDRLMLEEALGHAYEGLIITDPDGYIVKLNQAYATFLGVRLECCECHKHPHDRWTQDDFVGFTAAFAYINRSSDPALRMKKINLVGIYVTDQPLPHFRQARLVQRHREAPRVKDDSTQGKAFPGPPRAC